MPSCPLCHQFVKLKAGESPDARMNEHMGSGCKKHLLKKSAEEKHKLESKRKCGTCNNPNKYDTIICKQCNQQFCLTHRLPESHKCSVPSARDKKAAARNSRVTALMDKIKLNKEKKEEEKKQKQKQKEIKAKTTTSTTTTTTTTLEPTTANKSNWSLNSASSSSSGTSVRGDASIMNSERFYLEVVYPSGNLKGKSWESYYFHRTWTVGQAIDYICKQVSLPDPKKWKMVSARTGAAFPLDIPLQLLDPQLATGDTVKILS